MKRNFNGSIKDLMIDIIPDTYTKQTIVSLFRCFLETIIENRYDSVILAKLKDYKSFYGLFNRLKYTNSKVYSYSEAIEGFEHIKINNSSLNNDEFLIINAERFTACIYWDSVSTDVFGLCEGFCSLNPTDSRKIIDYLQLLSHSEKLESDLKSILQDRRNNEKFTTILRKLVTSLESRQRDIICANTELKELSEKTSQTEKLASIGQLCSTIAHELRNPLSVIDLHAKIISKNLEDIKFEDKETLEKIQNSSQLLSTAAGNLEQLLSELLDYSKPISIEMAEENLAETICEIVRLIKPSFENKNVSLETVNKIEENIKVNFDRSRIHQVVFNLLKNALEVSGSGQQVTVSLESSFENVMIKISDQGSGISEKDRQKIFNPYFTTKKEGTGLGLAQAKKIIEAHDGSLNLYLTGPGGTTFSIVLPAKTIFVKSY